MAVILFEKSLMDLVKGIRASKRDTGLYISTCIAEIKTELSSTDPFTKANALQKITFLQMMGYNMSWASFATVEVMSSPRFAHKRIGYLAACQAFNQDTEVVLLTTNLLKKELRGANAGRVEGTYEAGLAINCVSNIVTEDLARELLPEMTSLTSHPQPYIRKKAIMCLFKLFVKYPQALRLTFDQIRKSLDDPEPAVVSCAVNVITELSDKNPKNYLHLAPAFFNLLTNSSNNWMLIKVVKLLGSLVSEEPRLARKLLEPLATIVKSTQAKSLLYEAVYTITLALPYCQRADGSMPSNVPAIVQLCAQTLQMFVQEEDQNLKYLGLVGLNSLTISHPKILSSGGKHRDLILQCLSDDDVTIRTRALDLLTGMATRKNLKELIEQLLHHVDLAEGSYKADLVGKIVFMCKMEKYALIMDFKWYLATLIRLARARGIEKDHGQLLKSQIMDVALRVLPVRKYAVGQMAQILLDQKRRRTDVHEEFVIADTISAAAWIVGEYAHHIWDASENDVFTMDMDSKGPYHAIITAMLHPRSILRLDAETQAICVQSAMKVFGVACFQKRAKSNELEACVVTLYENLPIFAESHHKEVQERAFSFQQLLRLLGIRTNLSDNDQGEQEASVSVQDIGSEEPNLLGLNGQISIPMSPTLSPTVSKRCIDVAETLNYLLTPEPMKPIGAKAQRKKRLSPPALATNLDAPIDSSTFDFVLRNEKKFRTMGSNIDNVDFTEQRQITSKVENNSKFMNNNIDDRVSVDESKYDMLKAGGSFQQVNGDSQLSQSTTTRPREYDPFYLNTGVEHTGSTKGNNNKFGMIQLVSDEENEDTDSKRKKKSKKKGKKKKKKAIISDDTGGTNFNIFETNGDEASMQTSDYDYETSKNTLTVFESEDDDDDDEGNDDALGIFLNQSGSKNLKRSNKRSEEFSGLAKVDLTAPLRQDEVMPISTHRQVPERRKTPTAPKESKKKKSKKEKKEKKEKKDKKDKKDKKEKKKRQKGGDNNQTDFTAQTGDLLDFGSLIPMNDSTQIDATPTNAISSAFDDLLGLEQPKPDDSGADFSSLVESQQSPSLKESNKRPWMKGVIKSKAAKGIIEWKKIQVQFRTYSAKAQGGTAASITVRLTNNSSLKLQDIVIVLDTEEKHKLLLGDVSPSGGTSATTTKIGPFMYIENDEGNLHICGTLSTKGSSVPIKLTLPATMHLNPVHNLTQDDIMEELSTDWVEGSIKLELKSSKHIQIRPVLCAFLRAGEVQGNVSDIGTLAATTKRGSNVRVLFKVKKGGDGVSFAVKVDVKCTNQILCKSIISDLKRLQL